MIDVPLAAAFTAGLVAAVNPCGFPMLPAYLSWFIGTDDEAVAAGTRIPRALVSALAVSLGFLGVFAVLGIPIRAGISSVYEWMPWLTIVIGVALVALGIAMFRGYRPKLAIPRLDRGGRDRRFGSMVLFGVSYAITSLGCTLPLFLSYVAGTADSEGWASGAVAFLAYGSGMALVLLVLSLALALARDGMVGRMRSALQYVDRVAAVLLVVVGAYLVYYGFHAIDSGTTSSSGVDLVQELSDRFSAWLEEGGVELGVAFAVLVAVGLGWAVVRRPNRP